MMIGFLQWVRPAAGNYKLCLRMSRVIQRVMDRLFEPETEGVAALNTSAVPSETSGQIMLGSGMDDLNWLTSIDWSGGPFGDLDWLNNMDFDQNPTGE